jgi:hypothetical protein
MPYRVQVRPELLENGGGGSVSRLTSAVNPFSSRPKKSCATNQRGSNLLFAGQVPLKETKVFSTRER